MFATNTGKSEMVVSDGRNPTNEPWLWVPLALVMVEISAGPPPVRGNTQIFLNWNMVTFVTLGLCSPELGPMEYTN